MDKKFLTIVIALLLVAIVAAPVAAKPAVKKLASPVPLVPANYAKLTNSDHLVMLKWKPVADTRVTGYLVEVEGYSPTWDIWESFSSVPRITTDTSYQVDCFPCCSPISGFNPYRWRITALSSEPGSDSAPSKWRYFSYPDPTPKGIHIAKIRLVSPENKAKFKAGDLQSYEWKIVPGGSEYVLIHQVKTAGNEWTPHGGNPVVVFGSNPVFPYTNDYSPFAINPGTYRWRVYTYGSGLLSGAWSVSPWRTYTVI